MHHGDVRRVAVVGASNDRRKFGNKAVRAFRHRGFEVVPVNPREATIEGLPCYPSVLAVPGQIDLATLYVQPAVGESILGDLAAKGIREVWVNPGAESAALLARARALGLVPLVGCSIVRIGEDPAVY